MAKNIDMLTRKEMGTVTKIAKDLAGRAGDIANLPAAMEAYLGEDAASAYNDIVCGVRDFRSKFGSDKEKSVEDAIEELLKEQSEADQIKILLTLGSVLTRTLFSSANEDDIANIEDWNNTVAENEEKMKKLNDGDYLPSLATEDILTLKEKVCELFALNTEVLLSNTDVIQEVKSEYGFDTNDTDREDERILLAAAVYIAYKQGELPSLAKDNQAEYDPYSIGVWVSAGEEAAFSQMLYAKGKINKGILRNMLKAIVGVVLCLLFFKYGMAMALFAAGVFFSLVTSILGFGKIAVTIAVIVACVVGWVKFDMISDFFEKTIEVSGNVIDKAADLIHPVLDKVKEKAAVVTERLRPLLDAAKAKAVEIWGEIKNIFGKLKAAAKQSLEEVKGKVKDMGEKITSLRKTDPADPVLS